MIVSNFDAALRVVAANLGVSVVPRRGRRAPMRRSRGISVIPLNDAWAERSFAICFRQHEALQPASQRLLAHLEARAREMSTIAR